MSDKMMNRLVALGVFLVTITVYLKTLSVTVVFWDVGEFCAASRLLQVPHPPGSPLFVLVARIVSLIPFLPDIAARMHAISAFGSAFGVMFLYLVNVKIIGRFRAIETGVDQLIVYGASAIGAFALAFSTTYWDNAIEAEVYGMGMFFVSICLWLALKWWENADEPHNEKYFLIIAYLLGLSTGVHILALLVIIPIMMIYYFKRYEYTHKSFLIFGIIAVGSFFVVYPGIVQWLPSLLDGDVAGVKSEFFKFVPFLCVAVAAYGAYKTTQTHQKMLHIACLSFILIVIGYSTYTQVLIRSNVDNLPMKENNPNTLARLTSYLTREQYGEAPKLSGESWDNEAQDYKEKFFPRRYSREAMHEPTRVNYTSDGDFFWKYQVDHMFLRYIFWNFIGEEGDWQDGGVDWKQTWGIPFLIALVGLYYHFRKEWKMGLVLLAMFTIMGIVLDLYQNQQDPQPRERDYFYVGAYYCLAIWISVGVVALIDLLRKKMSEGSGFTVAASGILAVFVVAVPFNLARINYHEHDRSQNYIAWDYSYNLLQSCEPDAILFTNGDNDTFPLWYLQDVERVRTDVRIVNLSLVNTPWYVGMLKNDAPNGSKKVAMSFSNAQIEQLQPKLWRPRQIDIPVPKNIAEKFGVKDTAVLNRGKISFTMNGINMNPETKIVRVQDIMTLEIIMANHWERPIYFAVTCSPDSKLGLDNYLWMRGLAYRFKPEKIPNMEGGIGGLEEDIMVRNVLGENVTPVKTPQDGYLYRNLNNPAVYYDENVQRMVMNYRASFMRLAFYALRTGNNQEKAKKIMDRMDDLLPVSVIPNQDWRLTADIMNIFSQVGDKERFEKYALIIEQTCKDLISSNRVDQNDPFMPYRYLIDIYEGRKDYLSAINILKSAQAQFPNVPELASRIQLYEQKLKASSDTNSAKPK
jgi:hypothetical protein